MPAVPVRALVLQRRYLITLSSLVDISRNLDRLYAHWLLAWPPSHSEFGVKRIRR